MADLGLFPRDGRDLLVATGLLALALGLGVSGAGVIGAAPTPDPTRSVGALSPAGAASGEGGWRLAAQEDRPSIGSPEGAAVLASSGDDRGEYLTKMAAMLRRRTPAPSTLDPYQASLNPAVYLVGLRDRSLSTTAPRASHSPSHAGFENPFHTSSELTQDETLPVRTGLGNGRQDNQDGP